VLDSTRDARHATDVLDDVLAALPGDTTALAVFVLHQCDATATQVAIAARLHLSEPTVRRAWARLKAVDLVSKPIISDRSETTEPITSDRSNRSSARGSSRAGDQLLGSNALFPTGTTAEPSTANELARRVFAEKRPKPAGKRAFHATQSVATALLDAGWHCDDVFAALIAVPTITTGWCESWLNQHRKQRAVAAVDDAERRAAPGGIVQRPRWMRERDEREAL